MAYAAICNLLKVPYIIHLHGGGYEDFYFGSEKFMKRKIEKFFSRSAGIVLLHEGQIPLVRKILKNSPKTRILVLPNGVQTLDKNLYVAPLSSEPLRLVFLGNVSQEKGIPELLKAMATFSRDEVHLHLVGPVELNESDKLELSQAKSRGTVTSVGAKNKDEALSILAKSHLLILPSKVENFPNVILEAYSLGVPVIATSVGGITKLVLEGQTGWLLNANDQLEIEIVEKILQARRSLSAMPLISKRVFDLSHSTYDIKITAGLLQNFCTQTLDARLRSPEAAGKN
jgi:glycosyltransferase involved in cell wall biosynthesis